MRLWLDGQCLQTSSRFRGIGRYVTELIAAIAGTRPDVELMVSLNAALPEQAISARALLAAHIAPRNIHVWQGIAEGGEGMTGFTERRKLSEIALAHHVHMLAPDVALSASAFEGAFDEAVPYFPIQGSSVRNALIFYDAIPHRYPERYFSSEREKQYYERRLKKLSGFGHALAISGFSLAELKALVRGVDGTNIEAGVAPDFLDLVAAQAQAEAVVAWPRPATVLYVGGLDWRKNLVGTAQAFQHLPAELKARVEFQIVGLVDPHRAGDIRAAWSAAGLPDARLQFLGHIEDAALIRRYRRAGVVIQPSVMEGFGLTALEAMACGAPVIAATGSALAEVVQNVNAQFDPLDGRDIAQKIARALSDETFSRALVEEGLAQTKRYSWRKTAETAVAALERAFAVKKGMAARALPPTERARAIAERALAGIALEPNVVARAMAIAEPATGPRRLLVDTTATCESTHVTGIQRVVIKIADNLKGAGAGETRLIYGGVDARGFFEVVDAHGGMLEPPPPDGLRPVPLLRTDTVLMLDSSWTYHQSHANVLQRALLQGCEVISTLYDLVPVRTPAFCDPGMPGVFAAWLQSALAYSTGFVCISKAVADELMALLHAIEFPRPMKVGYWTLGADFATADHAIAPHPASPHPSGVSFLMVGTIEPRKGYAVALAAFDRLWRQGVDATLTIIGRSGWGVDELVARLRGHRAIGDRLIWIERASDADLAAAYAACDALISASYAEGFGLPVVEAGHFGKPVIASDLPVFREVARHAPAARFFAAGDPDALAAAVTEFIGNRAVAPAAAETRPESVSWAQSAEALRAVVCDGRWQMQYAPRTARLDVARTDMGRTRMAEVLALRSDAAQLDLVEGPVRRPGGGDVDLVVRVINGTSSAWSGVGPAGDDHLGIAVECTIAGSGNRRAAQGAASTRPPWVMTPGLSHYFRLAIPARLLSAGSVAEIVVRQSGGPELSRTLRVDLAGAETEARKSFAADIG